MTDKTGLRYGTKNTHRSGLRVGLQTTPASSKPWIAGRLGNCPANACWSVWSHHTIAIRRRDLVLLVHGCALRLYQICNPKCRLQTFSNCPQTVEAVITNAIRLRYDYDTTTTKNWHVHFCSSRIASNGSRRARYVVVGSQSYRKPISQLRFDYDRLRYDYDPTTSYGARLLPFDAIRREQKWTCQFFVVVMS